MVEQRMLEKRGRASDQENEKYRNPDKCTAVILRNDLLVHLHGVSPRSHTTYHIPSLKVKDGKFQARQDVTGLTEPHLGKLFGTDKETICFYLLQCKLLNKAQGTVEFKEWEGFVSSFPATTKRGSRSQTKPRQRAQLKVSRSRAGLGGQTAQYFLELSDPITSSIASKKHRSGTTNISFPRLEWPNLRGILRLKPQQTPPEIRCMKKHKAMGLHPRARLEAVTLSKTIQKGLVSYFFDDKGSLAVGKIKDSIDKLFAIKFGGSNTNDLRLMITFNLEHPDVRSVLDLLYGTNYIDESNEVIQKLGILIGGTEVQPLHTDFAPDSPLSCHPYAPRSLVLRFATENARNLHLAVQKDELEYIDEKMVRSKKCDERPTATFERLPKEGAANFEIITTNEDGFSFRGDCSHAGAQSPNHTEMKAFLKPLADAVIKQVPNWGNYVLDELQMKPKLVADCRLFADTWPKNAGEYHDGESCDRIYYGWPSKK